jgi:hypothetical protein
MRRTGLLVVSILVGLLGANSSAQQKPVPSTRKTTALVYSTYLGGGSAPTPCPKRSGVCRIHRAYPQRIYKPGERRCHAIS